MKNNDLLDTNVVSEVWKLRPNPHDLKYFWAATALEHDLTLVTRNFRDFAGIPGLRLLNHWEPTV